MHVSAFMTPRAKLATVEPDDSLKTAMQVILSKNIGCLVILENEFTPIGIITNRDLVYAYNKGMNAQKATVRDLMHTELVAVRHSDSRDQAASTFQHHGLHHAVVIDDDNQCVGLLSAWDIVVECAAAHRAWPWNRSDGGRLHKPIEHEDEHKTEDEPVPASPTSRRRDSHTFTDYIDSVRSLPFMDD